VGAPAPSGAFVTGTVLSALPITIGPGDTTKLKVKLTNITNGVYKGPVTINVFTSTNATLDNANSIATIQLPRVKLRPGRSKKVTLKFAFPNNLGAGDYFFFVTTDTSAMSTPSSS